MAPTGDQTDPRDTLWQRAFQIYYDAYYQQRLAERLARKWYAVDLFARLVVAVTASGSAVGAWAVWGQDAGRTIWAVVAAVAAVASVVHAALGVPSRLKELSDSRAAFLGVRTGAEALRLRMRLDAQFPIKTVATEIDRLATIKADAESELTVDLLRTRRLEEVVQAELDTVLAGELQSSGGRA